MIFTDYLINRLDFKQEAKEYLTDVRKKLAENNYELTFKEAAKKYCREKCSIDDAFKSVMDIDTGLHEYTVHFMFMLYAAEFLYEMYKENNISEDIFWNTMVELRCKLNECYTVYKIWGTFVGYWLADIFRMKRFGLGRLTYERTLFEYENYNKRGISIKKGDSVVGVHIPSSGPLTPEAVKESLKLAYSFFMSDTGKPMVVVCDSWLLDTRLGKVFPENSNIKKFVNLFDVIYRREDENFSDAWRIFSVDYTGNVSILPQKTALQKSIAEFLKEGKKTGIGFGVLVFDGEKVV